MLWFSNQRNNEVLNFEEPNPIGLPCWLNKHSTITASHKERSASTLSLSVCVSPVPATCAEQVNQDVGGRGGECGMGERRGETGWGGGWRGGEAAGRGRSGSDGYRSRLKQVQGDQLQVKRSLEFNDLKLRKRKGNLNPSSSCSGPTPAEYSTHLFGAVAPVVVMEVGRIGLGWAISVL